MKPAIRSNGAAVRSPASFSKLIVRLAADMHRDIIRLLAAKSMSVSAITEAMELDITVVSKHLHQLRDVGIVDDVHEKRLRIYRLGRCIHVVLDGDTLVVRVQSRDGQRVELYMDPALSME